MGGGGQGVVVSSLCFLSVAHLKTFPMGPRVHNILSVTVQVLGENMAPKTSPALHRAVWAFLQLIPLPQAHQLGLAGLRVNTQFPADCPGCCPSAIFSPPKLIHLKIHYPSPKLVDLPATFVATLETYVYRIVRTQFFPAIQSLLGLGPRASSIHLGPEEHS